MFARDRKLFIAPLCLSLVSCTIIIDGGEPPPPVTDPCDPEQQIIAPNAHIIANVRVERTVADLRVPYERWFQTVGAGLLTARMIPSRGAMMRLDEKASPLTPLGAWGCDVGGSALAPSEVIQHHAQNPLEGEAVRCALDGIIDAGRDMSQLVTQYPRPLRGISGLRVFGDAPDVVIIMHIDSLSRSFAADDAMCAATSQFADTNDEGHAMWLNYAPSARCDPGDAPEVCAARQVGHVPMDRVFHWFIYTDEGVDRDTFIDRCRRVEGLQTGVLDDLAPSSPRLYGPVAQRIREAGGNAAEISMCEMLAEDSERIFISEQIKNIVDKVGLTLDEDLLEALFDQAGEDGEVELPEGLPPNIDPFGGARRFDPEG